MSDSATEPTVRTFESDDSERVIDLVERSLTTSYALSPGEIESIREEEFTSTALAERADEDATELLVAETDGTLSGFVETYVPDDGGTVRWLHVDPECRGRGVGSALFDRAVATAEEGGGDARAVVLAANTEPGRFFERFDFAQVGEETAEVGDEERVQYVYAAGGPEASEAGRSEPAASAETGDVTDVDLPETVTTADDETLQVGDDPLQGTENAFVPTYRDDEHHGFYCLNCKSTDVAADSMDRLRCQDCGNVHKADADYDGSYL
jgi:ribosomal protein S18 acetylase RimI-like enzyme